MKKDFNPQDKAFPLSIPLSSGTFYLLCLNILRLASRGKWPPGERLLTNKIPLAGKVPKQSKQKPKTGKPKRGRTKNKSDKTYSCNFCNMTFDNRFIYSSHCGSTEHKENVFGRNKPVQSYARGGKAKSISMMARINKPVQYESDTTEDYENEADEQMKTVDQNEKADDEMENDVLEAVEEETGGLVESIETDVENKQTVVEEERGKNKTSEVSVAQVHVYHYINTHMQYTVIIAAV